MCSKFELILNTFTTTFFWDFLFVVVGLHVNLIWPYTFCHCLFVCAKREREITLYSMCFSNKNTNEIATAIFKHLYSTPWEHKQKTSKSLHLVSLLHLNNTIQNTFNNVFMFCLFVAKKSVYWQIIIYCKIRGENCHRLQTIFYVVLGLFIDINNT